MAIGVMAQDKRRPENEARQLYLMPKYSICFHGVNWEKFIFALLLVTSGQFPVPFCHMQRHQGSHLKASVERHTCCATRVVK